MKLCLVGPGYYPDVGGAEEYLRAMAERLAKGGHEVYVVVPGGKAADETRNGVHVHRLRARSIFSKRLAKLEGLEATLQELSPNLVHLQSHASLYSLQAVKACQKLDIPYVVLTYGPTIEHNRGGLLRDVLVEVVDFVTAKTILSGAAIVLYRTSNILPWCRQQGAKRLVQAPTGFDDAFLELPLQDRKKESEGKKVIGFVGGLSRRKGMLALVRALPKVLAKHSTALLVLVGGESEAGMKAELEAEARRLGVWRALRLVGNVDSSTPGGLKELVAWFDSFDVFCLPSAWEGPSQALLQALARGKPTITARIPAMEGLVDEKYNGIVEFGDVEGLAAVINAMLGDENRRKAAGKANRAAVAGYGFNRLAEKLEKTYAEAVAGASR